MEQKRAIVEKLRLAFEIENVIRKCAERKENDISNQFFDGAKHSPRSAHYTKCNEPQWRLSKSIEFSDL